MLSNFLAVGIKINSETLNKIVNPLFEQKNSEPTWSMRLDEGDLVTPLEQTLSLAHGVFATDSDPVHKCSVLAEIHDVRILGLGASVDAEVAKTDFSIHLLTQQVLGMVENKVAPMVPAEYGHITKKFDCNVNR